MDVVLAILFMSMATGLCGFIYGRYTKDDE